MSTSHIRYVREASAGNCRELVLANPHQGRVAVHLGPSQAAPSLRQREPRPAFAVDHRPLLERHLARWLHR